MRERDLRHVGVQGAYVPVETHAYQHEIEAGQAVSSERELLLRNLLHCLLVPRRLYRCILRARERDDIATQLLPFVEEERACRFI